MRRMNDWIPNHAARILLPGVAATLVLLGALANQAAAQGALTPTSSPGPIMKSLDQIEARTPISLAPFTITNSGSYYLTGNLRVTTGSAITIATNNVTIDLNGFTISSVANPASGAGILLNSRVRNISIFNGFIQGGVTNNNLGAYSGIGFTSGIDQTGILPANVRVSQVSVQGCLSHGIKFVAGNSTLVESCTVLTVGGIGINASVVRGCVVSDCGGDGIQANQVSDCRSDAAGTGIFADTVLNSYGSSSTSFSGIAGAVVQNSRGSSQSGTGLQAYEVAMNSQGVSTSGTGLNARNAAFSVGSRNAGGTSISATIANGSIAVGGTNSITYKYNMP